MDATSKKKTSSARKQVAPVPARAFANTQLTLFQSFLANTADEQDALSNAVDLWDSVPRYSISRIQMQALRTREGFLEEIEVPFHYRGKELKATIHPARVETKDGKKLSYYPGAREELVEHALRKICVDQQAGFFDQPTYRSGVRFTLHQLRKELEEQGHSLRYDQLIEALDILSLSVIEIEGEGNGEEATSFGRSPYLAALTGVKRKNYDADRSARWAAQFHPLVTHSIDKVAYRQFNYQRLMQSSTQLARWLLTQLVLKYTQASLLNNFTMHFNTIKRDSGLLSGYGRERDAIGAVDAAWEELKNLGALSDIAREEQRGRRKKLENVVYTLYPSPKFTAEQKAANRRQSDGKTRLTDSLKA